MSLPIKTLIVDDEALARERVRTLLANQDRFHVVGEAESGIDALRLIEHRQPDLVFLDIQMPVLSGLDVAEHLSSATIPAIVFVTAYDRHALKAFDLHALDYVLKPIDPHRFANTLAHVRSYLSGDARRQYTARVRAMLDTVEPVYAQQLVVRSMGRIDLVPVQDLIYINGAKNYVTLHTSSRTHVMRTTMQQMSQRLNPAFFVRIHRSCIVNFLHINKLRTNTRGHLFACLPDGKSLRVGPTYRKRVEAYVRRIEQASNPPLTSDHKDI